MSRLQKGELAEWVLDPSRNYYSGSDLKDAFYDISRAAYPDLIPERPASPPEPALKRSRTSPWPRTFSIVLDLGDLGEQDCSVIYRQCPEITIDSISLDGICIHKYLLSSVVDKIREKIQESLSDAQG